MALTEADVLRNDIAELWARIDAARVRHDDVVSFAERKLEEVRAARDVLQAEEEDPHSSHWRDIHNEALASLETQEATLMEILRRLDP